MNKEQFLNHVETYLNQTFPSFHFKKNSAEFSLHFTHDEKQDIFYLSNLYKEHQYNDLEHVLKPLVSFFSNFNKKEQSIPNFNRDKIIPIIRPFTKEKFLTKEVTDDLSIGYAIEHEDYIQYIEESMSNDLFNEEQIEKQAKKIYLQKDGYHPKKKNIRMQVVCFYFNSMKKNF